jgi:hypothetical protein
VRRRSGSDASLTAIDPSSPSAGGLDTRVFERLPQSVIEHHAADLFLE